MGADFPGVVFVAFGCFLSILYMIVIIQYFRVGKSMPFILIIICSLLIASIAVIAQGIIWICTQPKTPDEIYSNMPFKIALMFNNSASFSATWLFVYLYFEVAQKFLRLGRENSSFVITKDSIWNKIVKYGMVVLIVVCNMIFYLT